MLLCASALRPPRRHGPTPLVRLAHERGFDGIGLDAGVELAALSELVAEALRNGLEVPVLYGPVADAPLPPGKRLPILAALDDKEERLAAVKQTRRGIDVARPLGITRFVVRLGPVPLFVKRAAIDRAFARCELDEGEPGHRLWRQVLEERKAKGAWLLDACREAIEPLLRAAEQVDASLLLRVAAHPWQVPSPREAQELLREFRGAPLGLVSAPADRTVLARLGLGPGPERWAALDPDTRLVHATESVALDATYTLGLGEPSPPVEVATDVPILISGRADSTVGEVARAKELASGLRVKKGT